MYGERDGGVEGTEEGGEEAWSISLVSIDVANGVVVGSCIHKDQVKLKEPAAADKPQSHRHRVS